MTTNNGIFVDYIANGNASSNFTSHPSLSASVCGASLAAPVNFPGIVGVYGDVPQSDQPWPSNTANPTTAQWGQPTPTGHSYAFSSVSGIYIASKNAGQVPMVSAYRAPNYFCGYPPDGSQDGYVEQITWNQPQYDEIFASEMEYICATWGTKACIVGNEFKGLYGTKPNDYQISRYINTYNAIYDRLNANPVTQGVLMGGPYLYSANAGQSGATLATTGGFTGYPWPVEFSYGGYDLRPSDSNAIDTFIQQAHGIDIFATECTVGDWGVAGFQAFFEWCLSRFSVWKKPLPTAIMVPEFYAGTQTAANLHTYMDALCAAAAQYGVVAMFNIWDDMTVSNPGHTISSGGVLTDCGLAIQQYWAAGNTKAAFPGRATGTTGTGGTGGTGGGGTGNPPPTPTTSYPLAILHDNPQGYWRLNEATGTTAYDYSSNNNPGTYTGTVTLDSPGPLVGDSSTASMSSPKSGYVVVPNITQLDITGVAVSVECWVKSAGAQADYAGMIWKSNLDTNVGYGINTFPSSGPPCFVVFTANGVFNTPTFSWTWDTNWHHVVGVYDGSHATLYVDGVQKAQVTATGNIADSSGSALWLGGLTNLSSTNYLWNGSTAEHAVYGYALTAAQVTAHYQAGTGAATPTTSKVILATSGIVAIPTLQYRITGASTVTTSDAGTGAINGTILASSSSTTIHTTDSGALSGQFYTTGMSTVGTVDNGAAALGQAASGASTVTTVDAGYVASGLQPRWGVVQI